MKRLLSILLLVVTGCQSIREVARTTLTPEQRQEVITRARILAAESGLLSGPEKAVVIKANPELSYYFMAGPGFAQYFITWRLPERASITILGEGNLLLLEGAKILRKPNRHASVDAGLWLLLAVEDHRPGTTEHERSAVLKA